MTAGAIILAAGLSSRMAGGHKLLLEWNGKSLVAHVADAIAAAGLPPPVVVLGAQAEAIRAALGGRPALFVTATDHAEGLSRSLRAGIAAVPDDWQAALVCLGDMPRIEPALIAKLMALASRSVVAVPTHRGRRGNPVLWGRTHFPALLSLEGDQGARQLLDILRVNVVEVTSATDSIHADVDTLQDALLLREQPVS